ncbi:MAG: AAA family ATPase [Caulobacteraceae bacterium]|nr:AAA family ATPase [Caulobacteraceae bacterium]
MPGAVRTEADQAAIVAALESGQASGERAPLKRIDTHMSHLFLGATRVYKLKRAIRHPFADMSTPEARRRACEAELEVNRPLAPGLYEGVLPAVRGEDGAIRIGGAGEAVDWVVAMRRFEDGALLSEMAEAGRLTPELTLAAAEVTARFHAGLPSAHEGGHTADYQRIIEGLRQTEAQGAAALGVLPASAPLFDALEHELTRQTPLIEARRRAGWVRRGHGDLHLRNICLFAGRVTPFDALEFDPALATADVIYDVAFLLMDLRVRGLDWLANLAMNRYWDASDQPEAGLALLPLFMALRAAVRTAVTVEAGDLAEADRYRRLGLSLLKPPAARLAAIGGLSGTGKSALAQAVAPRLDGPCGARVLRSDVVRKILAGVAATDRLADAAYQPAARDAVYRELAERARAALGAGATVIADATFREDEARDEIEQAAGGHPFAGLWLTAPTPVRVERVARRQGDASDATAKVAADQVEPQRLGPGWRNLDADRPLEALAADLLAHGS